MDNITQEQIDALIEFIDNTEEPASITNVMAAAILAFLNLKVRQMVTVDDLNNEATARENTDTLLQGLIDALNQTAVRYSDVGEVIAELSTGTGMLLPDQSPLVIFKSMGAAYDGVQRTVTLYEGEASYPGSGNNYRYNKRGTVYPDMTVTSNRVYFNSYTGRLYKWAGSSFEAIGGGMDGAIYDIIKSNVNLVAAKLDALIGAMAMLAFSGTVNKESLKVGSLSWVEPETHEPRIITPLDGSTLEFGSTAIQTSRTILIQGADITRSLNLDITSGAQRFRLSATSITKEEANDGKNIVVFYTPSASVQDATGELTISSDEITSVRVNLHGTYSEQGGGDEPVQTPTISVSPSSLSFNAEAGQSAQQTFTVQGSNLTGDIQLSSSNNLFEVSPNSLSPTNGSVDAATVTVTYRPNAAGNHSGTITVSSTGAPSQSVGLSGSATAVASKKVVYKLLNYTPPSSASPSNNPFGYYEETLNTAAQFSKTLTVIQGAASNNDLTVKSGGVVKYKYGGSNNATGYAFSDGTLTITAAALALLTDDLIIEATAHTGTVTITANAAVNDGVTFNGGTAEDLASGSNDFSYDTISSLSFASGAKTKITSIDFGGAQFTGQSLASMFSGFTALTQVKGLVVTGSVNTLASMFSGCSALTVFDTIGWDTSRVENIKALAYNCSALTKVDMGSKDMSALIYAGDKDYDIYGTFTGCSVLTTLDVSYWNAPNLAVLRAFLYQCSSLTSFDASTWNAPNVWNMRGMFASCAAMTEIDISGISTAIANADDQITMDISHLFHLKNQGSNANLQKLTIGQFDTSSVNDVTSFFWMACTGTNIKLYCKSINVPSISPNASYVWFNNINHNNSVYRIKEVHVPSGKAADYYNAWAHVDLGGGSYANYIGLTEDKFIDDL